MVNILNSPDSLLASLFFREKPELFGSSHRAKWFGKNYILCQVGFVRQARLACSVGGILCPAVFEGGQKVEIDQLDISSGERQRLGVRSTDAGDDGRVLAHG